MAIREFSLIYHYATSHWEPCLAECSAREHKLARCMPCPPQSEEAMHITPAMSHG